MEDYISGWKRIHPDFELMLWNESNIDFSIPYLKRACENKKWANISNLVRLMAVQRYGGIYLDTDVQILKSFDRFLCHKCFVGFQEKTRKLDWVNNAVVGAEKDHWFIGELQNQLLKVFDGCEEANLSSPRLTTALLIRHGLKEYSEQGVELKDIEIFPTRYFYPYSFSNEFTVDCVKPDTYAVHHWSKSWTPS
jgi:mannosyltransferase OCH1-like enzyme